MRTQKQINALIEKYQGLLEYYLWNGNPHDTWEFLVEDLTQRYPDIDILGVCVHYPKIVCMDIHLMRHATLQVIEDCVKHEIAHAELPYGYGHGVRWKSIYKHLAGNMSKAQQKHFFFYGFKRWVDQGRGDEVVGTVCYDELSGVLSNYAPLN